MSNMQNDILFEQAISYLDMCGYNITVGRDDEHKITWTEDGKYQETFLGNMDIINLFQDGVGPEGGE